MSLARLRFLDGSEDFLLYEELQTGYLSHDLGVLVVQLVDATVQFRQLVTEVLHEADFLDEGVGRIPLPSG